VNDQGTEGCRNSVGEMTKTRVFIGHDVKKLPDNYAEYPYRDYDLIEFLKKVREKNDILAIYFDEESHFISFVIPSINVLRREEAEAS